MSLIYLKPLLVIQESNQLMWRISFPSIPRSPKNFGMRRSPTAPTARLGVTGFLEHGYLPNKMGNSVLKKPLKGWKTQFFFRGHWKQSLWKKKSFSPSQRHLFKVLQLLVNLGHSSTNSWTNRWTRFGYLLECWCTAGGVRKDKQCVMSYVCRVCFFL